VLAGLAGRPFGGATGGERVLLRAPLKPTVPADAQEIVSPLVSVMVTIVLLNVALMCATPRVTPLRIFFFGAGFGAGGVLLLVLPWLRCLCGGSSGLRRARHASFPLRNPIHCDPRRSCRREARGYLPSSFTPFLPATVLRGPLRVRALERVRWPRTGRLRR
jgi:hypothetical protein